jgi:hypothetical protein
MKEDFRMDKFALLPSLFEIIDTMLARERHFRLPHQDCAGWSKAPVLIVAKGVSQ